MNRILAGVTLYAELGMDHRAQVAADLLSRWQVYHKAAPCFDLLLIDNAVRHSLLRQAIDNFPRTEPRTQIAHNPENVGWAKGRNQMITVFMQGEWNNLVMMDQDMWIEEEDWLARIDELIDLEPNLHGYTLTVEKHDISETITLTDSGTSAYTMREYLGGINVIDRKVVELTGGYEIKELSPIWGYSDCLLGRRLIGSGLLDYVGRRYVDPIRVNTEHRNSTHLETYSTDLHNRLVGEYCGNFGRLAAQALAGTNLYSDYHVDIPNEINFTE